MPYLTVNGHRTHYELDDLTRASVGSQALLIQHGMGRNAQFWRHWAEALAARRPVIRRDLPGHGGSEDPGAEYPWTMDSLVADLVGFLDGLGMGRVHFLGESTGGMLGIAFAARYPQRLASLTLCASPTTIGPDAQRMFAFGHADWQSALRSLGSLGWARELSKLGGTMGNMSPRQREWTLAQFGSIPVRVLEGYSRMISQTDVAPLLGRIGVATLVLAPTRSAATPMAQQIAMQRAIPGAELVAIDGAAHEIYLDRAEDCMSAVSAFLHSSETRTSHG
jgi:pimeloyl-ACP methyl ester carboxylesterase